MKYVWTICFILAGALVADDAIRRACLEGIVTSQANAARIRRIALTASPTLTQTPSVRATATPTPAGR